MKRRRLLTRGLKIVLLLLCALAAIGVCFFSPYIVEGESMQTTLFNGDHMLANKEVYKLEKPQRGDIVIIKDTIHKVNYVKRLIGLPGDKIQIKKGYLFVNGKKEAENYLVKNRMEARKKGEILNQDFGPITVPAGKFFVMGDNRLKSMDSRNGLGLFPASAIVARCDLIYYPLKDFKIE
ncbi:signal peptidase I [Heyndrickxia acidicola]|uniref:Signal peptidase I n=1 Tax=Heyndrickxia acidicola TaxID=209389 RepID=A0ABU6MGL7_9BACI|nr:signal peptidase I [Heyndrickxia acidicola]MED1203824.1 signal peptidase I [Heyndrickxia acidicola]